jgi:hypothetical protein
MQYKIRHFPNSEYMYRGPVLTKTRKNGDTYILLTMYTMSHSTSAMNETIWSVHWTLWHINDQVNYTLPTAHVVKCKLTQNLGKHGMKASHYLLSSFDVGPAIIWRSKQQTKDKINKIVSRAKQTILLSQVVYQYLRSCSPAQPVPWTPARQLFNNNRWLTCFRGGILAR